MAQREELDLNSHATEKGSHRFALNLMHNSARSKLEICIMHSQPCLEKRGAWLCLGRDDSV